MSVRVVARIRPLLNSELDKDTIVWADSNNDGRQVVKIPNPKNETEEFSFAFNSVYDQATNQEALFTAEVAPHIKALFQGLDVTIFAYGVTGTGKTHTMRGGLKLAERGVIPRLLSNVFRRGKKIAKDTGGDTTVDIALSYYEIYNDKVFDLLEPPEKRTPAGLPLREKDGKTIVVGLSERSCEDLKDFERLYIEANNNRVTAATKLNAHSSRSHAILRVKVTQTTGDMVRESIASAIDLAGSEDNRRTDNGKERLIESAAINKSLFVLSQCIDAISRGDKRIPYRESKMTRILSLGQNNGITIMILNLAPIRSYHLDTLSSLNVSSRAKRIEVREIENEVVFKQPPRSTSLTGSNIQRQPLRPLANAHNVHTGTLAAKAAVEKDKPIKAFSVYTDRSKSAVQRTAPATASLRRSNSNKRPSDSEPAMRPTKLARPSQPSIARPQPAAQPSISAAQIEAMVERKVQEILAARAAAEAPKPTPESAQQSQSQSMSTEISEAVQRRLEALERRIEDGRHDDARSDGLRFLLLARQHKERGDDEGALRHYELALPSFPGQAKLLSKIEKLRARLAGKKDHGAGTVDPSSTAAGDAEPARKSRADKKSSKRSASYDADEQDDSYHDGGDADVDDESFMDKPARSKASRKLKARVHVMAVPPAGDASEEEAGALTPRKRQLLDIVNSRDVAAIRSLHGFGAKKARDLVDYLELMGEEEGGRLASMAQLRMVPGMGGRTLERAYEGLLAVSAV
ncbi:Kinesin-like protein KIF22 [Pleurostoma richardsiae]|uniref:Kinesin-like protein KIF22 n=1 Tax=Pleurostoma richardsiae TaxID=41990 RepID=A0AA38VBR6_9PEZI|nr:Kinesin-like protein KIF22 [Pleurostoma richardsiae]